MITPFLKVTRIKWNYPPSFLYADITAPGGKWATAAVGDGTTDDRFAFDGFNGWATTQGAAGYSIFLNIPATANSYRFKTKGKSYFASANGAGSTEAPPINQIIVSGYGATIDNNNDSANAAFQIGPSLGFPQANKYGVLTQSINPGDNTITVISQPSLTFISYIDNCTDGLTAPTAYFSFSSNPTSGKNIKLNGTTVTFGTDVTIGADLATTLQNLLSFLTASVNAQIVKCTYAADSTKLTVTSKTLGLTDTNFTISSTVASVPGTKLSGKCRLVVGGGGDTASVALWTRLNFNGATPAYVTLNDGFLPFTIVDSTHIDIPLIYKTSLDGWNTDVTNLVTGNVMNYFTVGRSILLAALDMQGNGYPINPNIFEYFTITAVNGNVITLDQTVKNTYKSTWPTLHYGNANGPCFPGGPVIYAMFNQWNSDFKWMGLTLTANNLQLSPSGRSSTYIDCTFNVSGDATSPDPSSCREVNFVRCTVNGGTSEVDKGVDSCTIVDCTFSDSLTHFSSSVNNLNILRSTLTLLNGTPKNVNVDSCNITTCSVGTIGYGYTQKVVFSNTKISNLTQHTGSNIITPVYKGVNNTGVQNTWTVSGNTITVPANQVSVSSQWIIVGCWYMLCDVNVTCVDIFKVLDAAYDISGNVLLTISKSYNSWPNFSWENGAMWLKIHPCVDSSFINCTGSIHALDYSSMPNNLPLYSHSIKQYDFNSPWSWPGKSSTSWATPCWGNVVKIVVNVTRAYTGALGTLRAYPLNQNTYRKADFSTVSYNSNYINLKKTGTRTLDCTQGYPASWSGADGTDSLPMLTEQIWACNAYSLSLGGADISGESTSLWPIFSVEIITDQGIN